VHILGYNTLLALDVLKDASQTTLYSQDVTDAWLTTAAGDLDATDIAGMAKAVLDRFTAENGSTRITYDPDEVPDTGVEVAYTFTQKTYREAIDILKSFAPENVYWYIDETGRFSFKPAPTTPTHTFIFGRHLSKIRVERSLEKVRNVALIFNGSYGSAVYKGYTDAASIASFGRRVERISDNGIEGATADDAMDARAAKFLAENKNSSVTLVATIIDNANGDYIGMDIEDINPGDTCRFVGFSSTMSDIFQDNMLITEVNYTLDSVQVRVELVKSGLLDIQQKQGRQINDINNGGLGIPESYT
jgi:hypothetical protein